MAILYVLKYPDLTKSCQFHVGHHKKNIYKSWTHKWMNWPQVPHNTVARTEGEGGRERQPPGGWLSG